MPSQLVLVKVIKDKRPVPNAVPENSTMFLVLLSVNRAMKILIIGTKEEMQRASVAPLVGLLRLEVLNVPRVVRVRTVMAVEIVKKVNTVTAVTQLWIHAEIAQRVFTTTTLAKLHVCHAVPVNSIMFQVLILVNLVRKILILGTKQGHQVAYHVM
jgi:hypothetical protein